MKIEPIPHSPFRLEAVSPGAWPTLRAVTLIIGEGAISFTNGELLVPYSRNEKLEALVARISVACEGFGLPPLAKLVNEELDRILP